MPDMPLVKALRRMHPSVSLEIACSRAAAVVRRAICVPLSEESQQPFHSSRAGLPPGGSEIPTDFFLRDREGTRGELVLTIWPLTMWS